MGNGKWLMVKKMLHLFIVYTCVAYILSTDQIGKMCRKYRWIFMRYLICVTHPQSNLPLHIFIIQMSNLNAILIIEIDI